MRIRIVTAVGLLLAVNFYTLPGSGLALGLSSNEYLKQVMLLVAGGLLLAWWPRLRLRGIPTTLVLLSFLAFGVYASMTLAWSESIVESLRFINKLWLALVLAFLVNAVPPTERRPLRRVVEVTMVSYMLLTIVSEILLRDVLLPERIGDPRLAGFGDIHGTKYLMSILAVYGFAVAIASGRKLWLFVSVISCTLVVLSLQRAIIGATFLALVGISTLEAVRRRSVWSVAAAGVLIPLLTIGVTAAVFRYPPLRDRMFATERESVLAERLLLSGRVPEVVGLVQLRGRDQFWSVARDLNPPFAGLGYGVAAMKIEEYTGERWEVHNDFLKLRVEVGPIGVAAYVWLLVVALTATAYRAVTTEKSVVAALYLASFGTYLIAPANGLFDNALDHVQKNLLYGTVFLLIAEGLRRDGRFDGSP